MVPNTGQVPLPEKGIGRYCVTGPLARRAEDLMPLLGILAGPDGEDPHCRPVTLGDPAAVRLDELEVILVPDNGRIGVHAALGQALEAAARALAPRVRTVRELRLPLLEHAFEIWAAAMSAEDVPSFASLLGDGTPIALGREFARWLAGPAIPFPRWRWRLWRRSRFRRATRGSAPSCVPSSPPCSPRARCCSIRRTPVRHRAIMSRS